MPINSSRNPPLAPRVALWAATCLVLAGVTGALAQTAPPDKPLAPASPGQSAAAPTGALQCDAPCVQSNMDRAAKACARPIEAQAPIDYEWLTRPYTGIFQEADKSSAQNSVVAYRGDSMRFQTAQKEWVRVIYQCAFDVAAQKVVNVLFRSGRLDRAPPVNLSAAMAGRPVAGGQTAASAMIAAALAKAGGAHGAPPAARSNRTIKFGEPSTISITQMAPSASP